MTKPKTTKLTAVLEQLSHLDSDQQVIANALRRLVSNSPDLDAAEQTLRNYTDWFIYRGGNHVAVSLASGDSRRILFIS